MPPVSRWMIRAAGASFLLGMVLWNVSGLGAGSVGARLAGALHSPSLHLLMVGGLTQMVFGVAWWMFPVRSGGRGRGPEWVAWVAFALLNVGCWARVMGGVLPLLGHPSMGRALTVLAAVSLPLAACCFAAMMSGRLRGPTRRSGGVG